MKLRAMFTKLGWTGVIAGLFAFLLMGASVPCGPSHSMDTVGLQQIANGSAETLQQDHHSTQHGGHSSTSDNCKDACCGAGCHVLSAPQVTAGPEVVFTRDFFSAAPDRVASGTLPFSIERPPRA